MCHIFSFLIATRVLLKPFSLANARNENKKYQEIIFLEKKFEVQKLKRKIAINKETLNIKNSL
jgi:hypothetical protein